MQNSDPKALGQDGTKLPNKDRSERRDLLFYQDEGGIRATDDYDNPENTLYYLGVIDILTPYNWYKRIEHAWRSCQYDAVRIAMRLQGGPSSRLTSLSCCRPPQHRISAVPPQEYGERFLAFLLSVSLTLVLALHLIAGHR